MFDRISNSWQIMGASWDVLKRDKSLVVFPFLSGICCLIVVASFAVPVVVTRAYVLPQNQGALAAHVAYYGTIFAFYFCNYFVITFFNTAIVSCAIRRMLGDEPTVASGLNAAVGRLHLIVLWSLFSATVGMVLRLISEKSGWLGRLVVSLVGGAWSILTYLVVPVILMENKTPLEAFKESSRLLKKTWGDQLVGTFSFGAIFALLMLPAFFIFILAVFLFVAQHQVVLAGVCVGIAVLYIIALSLIQSALQSIFQAAVYLHTQGALDSGAQIGRGFPVQLVQGALVAR
jgi:uncharacterized membrane protein (GlpM family)